MLEATSAAASQPEALRNWAKHSIRHDNVYFIPATVLFGLGGVQTINQSHLFLGFGFLGVAFWCLMRCAASWRRKVLVTDQGLYLRRGFRAELIEYERIRQLSVQQWDGGLLYLSYGPRPIKVASLSVGGREGNPVLLDWAYMPREQLRQFAEVLGKRCGRDFQERVEAAPTSGWRRRIEWLLW